MRKAMACKRTDAQRPIIEAVTGHESKYQLNVEVNIKATDKMTAKQMYYVMLGLKEIVQAYDANKMYII